MKNRDWYIDIVMVLLGVVFILGYISSRNKNNKIKEQQTTINNLKWEIRALNTTIKHQGAMVNFKDSLNNK